MVPRLMSLKLRAYGQTDAGLVRQNNEDVYQSQPHNRLFVLADGMGGHKAGEVAAEEAVSFLCRYMNDNMQGKALSYSQEQVRDLMQKAFQETNEAVHSLAQSHELLKGMGTTLCCLYFGEKEAIFGHVGDSRIYRYREGRLQQMTKDHSLLSEMLESGKISHEKASEFIYKNILTKAIGTEEHVEASFGISFMQLKDLYLLCSDGLTDMLSHQEIQIVLSQQLAVEEKVRALIGAAKRKGGFDNITVILIEVQEDDEEKDLSG